jgi:hypothetical protein
MAGAMASLESEAVAERAASTGPVVHRLGPVYGFDGERYAICDGCGERIDGADIAQVKELHRVHAVEARHACERERAAEVTPERLPAIRESLRAAAERKGGKA